MKKKLVYVEWADATHPEDSSWYTEEELKNWAKEDSYWVSQVGWIIEENKEYLLMAAQTAKTISAKIDSEGTTHWAAYLKIPKPWIRKRIDLTKYI